jgi:hypothetical protein
VDAGCSVGPCAGADGYLPLLEVGEEVVPLLVGGGAVLIAGPGRAAAGEERPVGLDRFGWVDRLVTEGGGDGRVPADDLRDVRRQAAHDGVGDEDPSKIVGREDEWVVGGIGQPGRGQGVEEQFSQRGGGDRPTLAADAALEQQRHGRVPDPFAHVVGGHQRDRAVRSA